MVNDPENDFIRCNEDGHIFDRELLDKPIEFGKHKGKTPIEVYGWNREEMINHKLDVIDRWRESTSYKPSEYCKLKN